MPLSLIGLYLVCCKIRTNNQQDTVRSFHLDGIRSTGDDKITADSTSSAINVQFVPEEELVPNIMGLRAYSEHRIASSSRWRRPQLLRCYV